MSRSRFDRGVRKVLLRRLFLSSIEYIVERTKEVSYVDILGSSILGRDSSIYKSYEVR